MRQLWSWMRRSDHEGVIPADVLRYMLMLIAEMVAPGAPGRLRNVLRLGECQ
jgi:hypothetical protein